MNIRIISEWFVLIFFSLFLISCSSGCSLLGDDEKAALNNVNSSIDELTAELRRADVAKIEESLAGLNETLTTLHLFFIESDIANLAQRLNSFQYEIAGLRRNLSQLENALEPLEELDEFTLQLEEGQEAAELLAQNIRATLEALSEDAEVGNETLSRIANEMAAFNTFLEGQRNLLATMERLLQEVGQGAQGDEFTPHDEND